MKILFVGDIVGKIGRRATAEILPTLKRREKIDFVIANVENLAHGKGVTEKTLQEMLTAGVDCFTSGNHVWKNKIVFEIIKEKKFPLLVPANYSYPSVGCGYQVFKISQKNIFVLNLQGRVYMQDLVLNPFTTFDKVLEENKNEKIDVILVDFHAETTSERIAFGHFADGRVEAVIGTHTHVQTADERILPKGTAYITDAGFVGGQDTSLGVKLEGVIDTYLTGDIHRHEIPEVGEAVFNSVLLEFDKNNKVKKITRLNKEIKIK